MLCRLGKIIYTRSGSKNLLHFPSFLRGLRLMALPLLPQHILLSIHCLIRCVLLHGYHVLMEICLLVWLDIANMPPSSF